MLPEAFLASCWSGRVAVLLMNISYCVNADEPKRRRYIDSAPGEQEMLVASRKVLQGIDERAGRSDSENCGSQQQYLSSDPGRPWRRKASRDRTEFGHRLFLKCDWTSTCNFT